LPAIPRASWSKSPLYTEKAIRNMI
jgi:hypothetical protein